MSDKTSSRRERVASRDAAKAAGLIAQTAFGPDAARRNLATSPIYKVPPAAETPDDVLKREIADAITHHVKGSFALSREDVARLYDVPLEMLDDGRPPAPAAKHVSECYGFADGWGCDPACPVGGSHVG